VIRRDDEVDGDVVLGHREVGVDDLELVDGRQHGRPLVDRAELAGQRPLEVAVTAALADPCPAPVDGDTARDDQIDAAELARKDGLAESGRAPDRRRFRQPATEPRWIESQEAAHGAQARHGHEHRLTVAQRAQPQRPLGRVGIALQPPRERPFRQLGHACRRALGAHKVRDPVLDGKGKTCDTPLAQERPHALAKRLLRGRSCRTAGGGRHAAALRRLLDDVAAHPAPHAEQLRLVAGRDVELVEARREILRDDVEVRVADAEPDVRGLHVGTQVGAGPAGRLAEELRELLADERKIRALE